MVTNLCIIGNHLIKFNQRTYKQVTSELIAKLNETSLLIEKIFSSSTSEIAKSGWLATYENDVYAFSRDRIIYLKGPFNLEIWVDEYTITFFNPDCRYNEWFTQFKPSERNLWRRYFHLVEKALGGSKVIYLADNGTNHERLIDLDQPFSAIEKQLEKHMGKPLNHFSGIDCINHTNYMIDNLSDL